MNTQVKYCSFTEYAFLHETGRRRRGVTPAAPETAAAARKNRFCDGGARPTAVSAETPTTAASAVPADEGRGEPGDGGREVQEAARVGAVHAGCERSAVARLVPRRPGGPARGRAAVASVRRWGAAAERRCGGRRRGSRGCGGLGRAGRCKREQWRGLRVWRVPRRAHRRERPAAGPVDGHVGPNGRRAAQPTAPYSGRRATRQTASAPEPPPTLFMFPGPGQLKLATARPVRFVVSACLRQVREKKCFTLCHKRGTIIIIIVFVFFFLTELSV